MTASDPDYLIVGSGAAGCTLAHEIVSRGMGRVVMMEAGPAPRSSRLRVPADYLQAFGSRWDWDYRTEPQQELGGRSVRWPAGRALGGSTSINAMIWIEPDSRDFHAWQEAAGPAWSQDRIDIAFQRVRDWLGTAQLPQCPPLHRRMRRMLEASAAQGSAAPNYPNGWVRPAEGIDAYRRMQSRGRRVSLWNLLERSCNGKNTSRRGSLAIQSDARVLRLLFDGDRTVGVRCVDRSGEVFERRASRGVVVCAGALETPRLLMASGLGPREMLAWAGIPVRVDLPDLGTHLQDHLVFPIVMQTDATDSAVDLQREERIEYLRHRTGPRSSNLAELGCFLSNARDGSQRLQLHITPTHYLEPIPFGSRQSHVSVGVTLLDGDARGAIGLARARGEWDPDGPPPLSIDPRYLAADLDMESWLGAIETVRRWVGNSPWHPWIGHEIFPKWTQSDRLASYVRRFVSTIYHYAGTCSMGTLRTHCLNSSLQVRGVERLWVCDASAMPHLVGCNPQATVAMMAARLAEMLDESI